jgi:hypothetical protein
MMSRDGLSCEFPRRVNGGVDVAAENLLRAGKECCNGSEGGSANNHQVDITGGLFLTAGDGSEKKRDANLRCERPEGVGNQTGSAGGFEDQGTEIGIKGVHRIGGVEHLAPDVAALKDADAGERFQFSLHGPHTASGKSDDVTEVELLAGASKKDLKDRGTGLPKEKRRQSG